MTWDEPVHPLTCVCARCQRDLAKAQAAGFPTVAEWIKSLVRAAWQGVRPTRYEVHTCPACEGRGTMIVVEGD